MIHNREAAMPNFQPLLSCLGAVAVTAAATMPALAQKVDYDARFPAKNREAATLTSLAVLPFRGTDGDAFTSAIIASLQSSVLDGRPYFSVKTLEGMNYRPPAPPPTPARGKGRGRRAAPAATISPSGEIAAAVRLGQQLGVSAIYTGEVIGATLSRRNYNESKMVCEKQSDGKCKMVQVPVPCVDTSINYSVTPRIISVATGQVVYSRTVAKSRNYILCDGQVKFQGTLADAVSDLGRTLGGMFRRTTKKNPNEAEADKPVSTDADLLTRVRSDVADAVRYDVSPYNFKVTVEFKDDQVKFRNASEFAKAKRLDRACSDWESLNTPANAGSINLLFNLGVCQEVLVPEDPTSALNFLAKADSLTTRPDPMINKALERVRRMVDAQTEISRQLRPNGTNK
jgi:hypothetical protein